MTINDGHVVSGNNPTKVIDHGPDDARWNLVIVGDGYQANELAKYHTDVANFINELQNTHPFDIFFSVINVHRIDVFSNDSGADNPGCEDHPANPTPPGPFVNTYFDATFC